MKLHHHHYGRDQNRDLGISGYDGSMVPEGNIQPAPDMNSSYWACSQALKGSKAS